VTSPPILLPPLVKTITVPWPPQRAFHRFTAELASWWPLASHSVGGPRAVRCGFEPQVGGHIYEELDDGTRHIWGTVTAWQPPERVAFTWHPAREPDTAQEVSVRFIPEADGTRLELTHTGWERLGKDARRARRAYPLGWTYVLNCWAGRQRAATNLMLDGVIAVLRTIERLRRGRTV